jgi:hypothetical protein
MVVHLVQKTPVEALVERLKAGKLISKEQVLRESEYVALPHCAVADTI